MSTPLPPTESPQRKRSGLPKRTTKEKARCGALFLSQNHGPDYPEIARQLNNIAVDYDEEGQYAEAEPLFERAISIAQKIPVGIGLLAAALNGLGANQAEQGKYLEVTPLYERALEIHERVLGMENPFVAIELNNIAAAFAELGRYAEAEQLSRRALAIKEKNSGLEHPDVALALGNLGNLY